jgi:RND family efflux transporter MFP subunit
MATEKLEPAPLKPKPAPIMSSNEPTESNSKKPGGKIALLLMGLAAVLVIGFVLWKTSSHAPEQPAEIVTVAVAPVTRTNLFNQVTIPAEFRPYSEVELHAKISGYVDQMTVDFGDKVKAGQLLATLEVPELRDQMHTAIAQRQKAEADYTNAAQLLNRLKTVNEQHPDLVAQQDLDNAQAKESVANAAIAGAKAEVERYQTLTNYTRITAPFDGVVTKRYLDPGALIAATQSVPLFRVSDNYHLRLDFPVSVDYVKDIHIGDEVIVRVDSLNGAAITGKVSRSTERVNMDTRTMTVEVEVDNPDLKIVPGMYASVELRLHRQENVLSVPIQAVSGGKEPTVYVVNQNSEIEPRRVTLGIETPEAFEVVSGLKEGELVMIGNRAMVAPGQKVEKKVIRQ